MSLTFGSLFSGIGGMDRGLEMAGMVCKWQIEIDEWCRKVLAKHWPDVPKFGDIKEVTGNELEPVDVLAGGFPCQSSSHAGKRRGRDDERWLWPEFARLIRELRPRYVLVENVPGILAPFRDSATGRVLGPAPIDEVLGDLAGCGFDAEWTCLSAAAFGAPHIRDRVFIVAYPSRNGRITPTRSVVLAHTNGRGFQKCTQRHSEEKQDTADRYPQGLYPDRCSHSMANTYSQPLVWTAKPRPERHPWEVEPDVGRVANGILARVDRLRGLGNSVVSQIIEYIGGLIIAHAEVLERRKE